MRTKRYRYVVGINNRNKKFYIFRYKNLSDKPLRLKQEYLTAHEAEKALLQLAKRVNGEIQTFEDV